MGSGCSPQNAQFTSITSNAGRAPKPPAAKTALSRSVRNLSQIRSVMLFCFPLGGLWLSALCRNQPVIPANSTDAEHNGRASHAAGDAYPTQDVGAGLSLLPLFPLF